MRTDVPSPSWSCSGTQVPSCPCRTFPRARCADLPGLCPFKAPDRVLCPLPGGPRSREPQAGWTPEAQGGSPRAPAPGLQVWTREALPLETTLPGQDGPVPRSLKVDPSLGGASASSVNVSDVCGQGQTHKGAVSRGPGTGEAVAGDKASSSGTQRLAAVQPGRFGDGNLARPPPCPHLSTRESPRPPRGDGGTHRAPSESTSGPGQGLAIPKALAEHCPCSFPESLTSASRYRHRHH